MSSERSIPHLRDIFSLSGYSSSHNNHNNLNGQEQQHQQQLLQQQLDKKQTNKKRRDNNKTLTSGDVKTLERHLSMKKTIRKKIMRDLQQAFVEDPNEFRIDNTTAEINTEALSFGDKNKTTRETDNFLDMLRGDPYCNNNKNLNENNRNEYNSNINITNQYNDTSMTSSSMTPTNNEKQSFWRRFTMKSKIKR